MNDGSGGSEVVFWWMGRIGLALCGCFFILFGIHVLIASFFLADPSLFIMSFLASTMIILFSAAILAGLLAQMIRRARSGSGEQPKQMNGDQ